MKLPADPFSLSQAVAYWLRDRNDEEAALKEFSAAWELAYTKGYNDCRKDIVKVLEETCL